MKGNFMLGGSACVGAKRRGWGRKQSREVGEAPGQGRGPAEASSPLSVLLGPDHTGSPD